MLDTRTNVKARLGITVDTYNSFLDTQITLISDVIEAYCRRKFVSASYEQTFFNTDYKPNKVLDLFYYPVSEITSIVEDGETLDEDSYRLNSPTGKITRTDGIFFRADETVVTFVAGYEDVPTPVIAVLDAIIQERYNKHTSGVNLNFGSDVQRISIPGAISIDFDYSLSNNDRKSAYGVILGNNVNILDNYRSERAVIGSSKLIYIEDV